MGLPPPGPNGIVQGEPKSRRGGLLGKEQKAIDGPGILSSQRSCAYSARPLRYSDKRERCWADCLGCTGATIKEILREAILVLQPPILCPSPQIAAARRMLRKRHPFAIDWVHARK